MDGGSKRGITGKSNQDGMSLLVNYATICAESLKQILSMPERKRILMVLGFLSPEIIAGFTRYAREANWILNTLSVLHGAVPGDWRADGLLTTNVFRPELRRFVRATARRLPTVLHGCDDLGLGTPRVEFDERAAGRLAAEHLLEQRHRNFACFRYSKNRHALRRMEGFRAALSGAGHGCVELERLSPHGQGMRDWFARRLVRLPRPLGLYAEDDSLAASAIDAALDAGWTVPGDLAVVGTGNLALVCEQSPVPLTTVALPFEEMAYRAAVMLDRMLAGRGPGPRQRLMPPVGIVARQSTNAVAARRPVVKRALGIIEARLGDAELDARAVASGSGVSLRLLYSEFARDLGSTPAAELMRMRIRRARQRLRTTDEKISAVAAGCGFGNARTFQRAFAKAEGISPGRWRAARPTHEQEENSPRRHEDSKGF
jgi:LacI family transcriptional regulator